MARKRTGVALRVAQAKLGHSQGSRCNGINDQYFLMIREHLRAIFNTVELLVAESNTLPFLGLGFPVATVARWRILGHVMLGIGVVWR